jgi:hypothetical protein
MIYPIDFLNLAYGHWWKGASPKLHLLMSLCICKYNKINACIYTSIYLLPIEAIAFNMDLGSSKSIVSLSKSGGNVAAFNV